MGRAARRKQQRPRSEPPPPQKQRVPHLHRARTILATLITALATYVTVFGFVLPRVTVSALADMDPRDPYKQIFTVTNESNLELHDLFYMCQMKGAWLDGTTAPFTIHHDENEWMRMVPFQNQAKLLASSETDSLTCQWFEQPLPFMLEDKREIAIDVYYRPAYFPFRFSKRFVFLLARSSVGAYHWLPVAARRH